MKGMWIPYHNLHYYLCTNVSEIHYTTHVIYIYIVHCSVPGLSSSKSISVCRFGKARKLHTKKHKEMCEVDRNEFYNEIYCVHLLSSENLLRDKESL